MKKIKLTQGKFALVDDKDFEKVNQYKWHASKSYNTFYAIRKKDGETIRMHRVIMGFVKGDLRQVDHINSNGLDNRRSNLRECSNQQNQFNMKARIGCSSKYKGVSWAKGRNKWLAQIQVDDKDFHLGYFKREIDAAKAYDKKATELCGEFARLNIRKEE